MQYSKNEFFIYLRHLLWVKSILSSEMMSMSLMLSG